ncbi:helix-turn-helix domain-containing protein [Nostoc sp. CHAB 5844]|nr:helix-turn-helix domain-containing protein [Nostoc sp. CHAB 5844]
MQDFDEELSRFGKSIRELRQQAGLSQEELANICGLDRTYLGGIERGERNPTLKNILLICRGLDIPASKLFDSQITAAR